VKAISFVLPAYNEEGNVLRAVQSVVDVAKRYCSEYEVIVVDDGSTDRTAELVTSAAKDIPELRLVRHAGNRGYGEALKSGLEATRLEWVFFTDADNQFDLDDLRLLLPWTAQADVIVGYRKDRQDPLGRKAGAWVWNRLVRMLFCVPVRDVDCAFKLFRRSTLGDLDIQSGGAMVSTEIMVKLHRAGLAIIELGVTHLPRTAGKAHGANPRVVGRALVELARMYRRLNRLGPGPSALPAPGNVTGRRSVVRGEGEI